MDLDMGLLGSQGLNLSIDMGLDMTNFGGSGHVYGPGFGSFSAYFGRHGTSYGPFGGSYLAYCGSIWAYFKGSESTSWPILSSVSLFSSKYSKIQATNSE